MKELNVGVLGATGAVGQEMLKILAERNFPVKSLRPLASARSAGKMIRFKGEDVPIAEAREDAFKGLDLVLGAAEFPLVLPLLAVLEIEQGRDVADAVLHGDVLAVIHVALGHDGLAVELGGHLVHGRGKDAAGAAPGGPEVDQDWLRRSEHLADIVRIDNDFHTSSISVLAFGQKRP